MAAQKKGKGSRARSAATARGESAAGVAHQIWLAGLGALARAQSEGPKMFESLAAEGAVIQERGRRATEAAVKGAVTGVRTAVDARVDAVRGRASDAIENIEKVFQARVQKALQQVGVPTTHEIDNLSRKVTELTRSVQALTRGGRSAGRPARAKTQAARQGARRQRAQGARRQRASQSGAQQSAAV